MPQGQNDVGKGEDFEEPRRSLEFERFPKAIREALHEAPADLTVAGVRNALLGHYDDQAYISALAEQIRNWKPKPGDGKFLGYRADAIHDRGAWRARVMAVTEFGEWEAYHQPFFSSEAEASQHADIVCAERTAYFKSSPV